MVYEYYPGRVADDGPFGTNNFSPRWSTRLTVDDYYGKATRKDIETAIQSMKHQSGLPPWKQQAGGGHADRFSNMRLYPQHDYIVRNLDFSPRELRSRVLPPIASTERQQLDNIGAKKLEERLGQCLCLHSEYQLDRVRQSLTANDKQKSGYIPTSTADGVLTKMRYPDEEDLRRALIGKYLVGDSDWVQYEPMLSYMRNARELHAVKHGGPHCGDKIKFKPLPVLSSRRVVGATSHVDLTAKPTEIIPTGVDYLSLSHDHFHGASLRAAFHDRRDAVLIIEMEKQYSRDPRHPSELTDALKENLRAIAEDDASVPPHKVKALMQKLKFPFNGALVDKLIDRAMMSATSGTISWVDFTTFLNRAVRGIPRSQAATAQDQRIISRLHPKENHHNIIESGSTLRHTRLNRVDLTQDKDNRFHPSSSNADIFCNHPPGLFRDVQSAPAFQPR